MADTRAPLPGVPGPPACVDDEYERKGTANLCMIFEPLAGQRRGKMTERRTAVDGATHTPTSLYEAFAPAEVRRLMERLAMHDTPQHGRWFNMAESELSVLAAHCLDRRIPDPLTLTQEVAA